MRGGRSIVSAMVGLKPADGMTGRLKNFQRAHDSQSVMGVNPGDSVGIDVLGKRVMGPVKESIAGALLPRLGVKEVEHGGTT